MSERRVYFWHLKALGYCNRKMRVWCREHGVSWLELRQEGIAADRLLALDDGSMAQAAVAFAKATGWSDMPENRDGDQVSGGCI